MICVDGNKINIDSYFQLISKDTPNADLIRDIKKSKDYDTAKDHSIRNIIASLVHGVLSGTTLTAFGVYAWPIIGSGRLNEILNVSYPECFLNTLILTWRNYEFTQNAYLLSSISKQFFEKVTFCSNINYQLGLHKTIEEQQHLIQVGLVTSIVMISFLKLRSYRNAQKKAEDRVIQKLETSLSVIKMRMKMILEGSKCEELARNILEYQGEIKEEAYALGLPSLSKERITKMTASLFEEASRIICPQPDSESSSP